ncbi:MAG: hypothetical protein EU981_00965 [Candidatus Liberibacter ctenarytainae]|uniref:Uncharacterized protein n=1 Tax=Candidatus Liberibacter ctenarytainae TaxID=2020335 RepID=A0A937DIS8_9HYPH|nr:hypothetical protein [Candidatus Liberibacter ctenarytainae]
MEFHQKVPFKILVIYRILVGYGLTGGSSLEGKKIKVHGAPLCLNVLRDDIEANKHGLVLGPYYNQVNIKNCKNQ